jgi:S1-C subfamily serine protease
MLDPTELEVNGNISARSTGFGDVIEHDSVLVPEHCGGPIIDVQGNVVGLNIARAGRVSCYALRAKTVSKAIEEMLQTASEIQDATVVSEKGAIEKGSSDVVPASAKTPEPSSEIGSGLKIESLKPPSR